MNKLTTILGILLCTIIFFGVSASPTFAIPPTVTITAPSGQTATGITLNGNFNANSISTTAYFRYWENDPGSCVDAGGTRVPSPVGGTTFADGGSHGFSQAITGLFPNKTYYYCAIGTNTSAQTTYHSTTTSTFSTSNGQTNPCDIPPDTQTAGYTVTAGASCSFPLQPVGANVSLGTVAGMDGGSLTLGSGASLLLLANQTIVFQSITKTGAAINKSPGGVMRKGYIYVKDADNDNFYAANSTTYSASAADGALTGQGYKRRYLITGSSYITQAVDCDDTNAAKNIPSTCAASGAVTGTTTATSSTAVTLNGTANPNGDNGTQAYFKYGTVNTGDCSTLHTNDGASTSAQIITGTSSQPFSASPTGLTTGTTYYWCSIVYNNVGTTYSTIGTFVPLAAPAAPTFSGVTQTNITVNWTPPSGALGFKIYRCTGVSCTPTTTLATDANNASPHADATATCGNTYGYQVTATSGAGGTGTESIKSTIAYQATSSCVSAPTLSSPTATSITGTSATLGGNITSNGGAALNARGTCWSTSDTDPRIGDAGVNCLAEGGTSTGVFTHARTSLTPSSTVYYTAYATNTSALTGYTTATSFSTPALLANGSTCTAGSECSSGICYVDGDSDRYAPSSGTKTCRASTQLGSTGADCDDTKNTVYTGQTAYSATAIGAGGPKAGTYDYDCDGDTTSATERFLPSGTYSTQITTLTAHACSAGGGTGQMRGWVGSVPSCGATGTFRKCSVYSDGSCNIISTDPWTFTACSGGSSTIVLDRAWTGGALQCR